MAATRDTIDDLDWRTKEVTSRVESKVMYHQDSLIEYKNIKFVINGLTEQKERMEQEHHAIKELVLPMEQELVAVKEELEEAKEECEAAKEECEAAKEECEAAKVELVQAKQQLAQKNRELDEMNKELQALRKKLQEGQAMEAQFEVEQRHGSAPQPVQSTRETRSARKRKMAPHESLGNDANKHHLQKERSCLQLPNNLTISHHGSRGDDLEVIRQKMIEGFKEIDGGRYLGVKEIGKLNEKPFRDACAQKMPRKQSAAEASKLYTLWEELLNHPEWIPFKTDCQEVIDVDDDKLQELKMAWGEGPYSAVVTALVERKEYNTDRTGVFELWNYKERRKATLGECVEYIFSQVKKLKQFHTRTLR